MTRILLACLAVLTTGSTLLAALPEVTAKMRPIAWDPAPLPPVHVPADRPRIWFTASQVVELRKRCRTTCRKEFESIQAAVGKGSERPSVMAFNLAFLYQMTGDASYARRALAIVRKSKPFEWFTFQGAGYPGAEWYANQADTAACVFDWCYDQLAPDDTKSIGELLRTQLARGPYRMEFHQAWWIPCWLSEVLALYEAGIDDKLAAEHLAILNRVVHQFTAVADEIQADSAFGDYHHQFNYHWAIPEMWLQGTGENLFRKCGYFGTQPAYILYLALPDGHWISNDGDGPTDLLGSCHESFMPISETVAVYGLRNDNPYARWTARNLEGWRHTGFGNPWKSIMWTDPSSVERPLKELPPVKLFPNNNCAILRSGWNLDKRSTDTVAAFYCRPVGGHTHYDVGHFVIWRGLDQLVQRNGFYANPNSEYHKNFFVRTIAHNCVTIRDPQETPAHNGKARDGGQLAGDSQHYGASQRLLMGVGPWRYRGEIRTFVDRPQWTYLFADLTPAYEASKATRVVRGFLWLKPSTFLVCDWVTSTRPEFTKRWLLSVATRPAIDGSEQVVAGSAEAGILESSDTRRLTVARGASKLFVQPLLPEHALVRRLGGEGYSSWSDGKNWIPPTIKGFKEDLEEAAKHFWRIEIEPLRAATDDVFLNLLDTAAAETASPPSAATVQRDGEAVGAEIRRAAGSTAVLFYPDGRLRIEDEMIGPAHASLKAFQER